ncbi:hypothetical protein BGW37DRAFT_432323, partial [Umbelopsis sp. PMI_123]
LASGPCKAASAALSTELTEQHPELLPSRFNWKGESQPLTLDELTSRNSHIASSHLHDLLQRLVQHTDTLLPPPANGSSTLLGPGDASLLRTSSVHNEKPYIPRAPRSRLGKHMLSHPIRQVFNSCLALTARELGGNVLKDQRQPAFVSRSYKELVTLFGHRFPIYCVTFDKSGLRVITGSDDYLVKIWCARTGYLIYTLRGHQKEITDLTLNEENSLLATASTDGIIRVWSMKDFRPIAVLTSGTTSRKGFTTVNFSPSPMSDTRYLMATSEDGMVRLWRWDRQTLQFFDPHAPITFPCRFRLKDQVRCASFNRSGTQFAVSGDDGIKKGRPSLMQNFDMSALESSNVVPVANLEGHHGGITDIAYSHDGKKILSGCMDGTARIWYIDNETNEWKSLIRKYILLPTGIIANIIYLRCRDHNGDTPSYNMRLRRNTNNVNQDQNGYDNSGVAGDVQMQGQQGPPSRESAYVSMIAWSLDDSACIIATTYGDLKVFDSTTGELKGSLIGHTEETYAVDVHPTDPRTVLSAGYDGRAILWDLATFTQMSCHYYPERNLLDCKFSKDGMMYAITDSEGKCVLFGVGQPTQPYSQTKKWQRGQQFWTDFLPVRYDENWNFIDEQTQLPPHMMDRSLIIDWGGVEYPNQKPAGYGRNLPLTNKHFDYEEQQRRAWYNEEMQEAKQAHIAAVPKIDRAKASKKRKDFVHIEEEETEDLAIFDIPIRAMENDESDDEDYTDVQDDSASSDESDEDGSNGGMVGGDLDSNDGIDDDEFVEDDEAGDSGYRARRKTRGRPKRRGRPPADRTGSSSRPTTSSGRRRGRPKKTRRLPSADSDGTESSRHMRRSRNRQISYAEDDDTDKEFIESNESEDESEEVDVVGSNATHRNGARTSDDEDFKDVASEPMPSTTRSVKRRAVVYDEEDDADDQDFMEGPSVKRRRLQSVEVPAPANPPKKRGRPRKNPLPEQANNVSSSEAPQGLELSDYEPTEWIQMETRKLSPYHPQVDDMIVICVEGHEEYWNQSAYVNNFNPKHGPITDMGKMIFARVIGYQWQVGPPTFCRLKLRLQNLTNIQDALFQRADPIWRNVGRDITIDYCDEDNCPEFLVLFNRFLSSMEVWSYLEIGQKVDAVYDNGAYPGTIVGIQTDGGNWDELNLPSPWAYFHIVWDDPNSPPENLSPWELVPRGQDLFQRYDNAESLPDDVKNRAINVLNWLKDEGDYELFVDHVPWHDYPDYLLQIAYPICINMVLNRLNNNFYRHAEVKNLVVLCF